MSSPETIVLGVAGAVIGVLISTGIVGPTVMFSDAGYAMVGIIVSSFIGATATVAVAYITVNANRRSRERDKDEDDDTDDPPRKSP